MRFAAANTFSVARTALLPLCLLLFFAQLQAGPRLEQLKRDLKRLKSATLLVAPILADSFELARLQKKGPEAIAAYERFLSLANTNLRDAMSRNYNFSRFQPLTGIRNYKHYFDTLATFQADSFFVLQFGRAMQFAESPARRIRPYDSDFLAIYSADGRRRVYLNVGKLDLFDRPEYATAIVSNLQRNLDNYTREKRAKRRKARSQDLLVPALARQVRIIEQEQLYGAQRSSFRGPQWQTVLSTSPIQLHRFFGGTEPAGAELASFSVLADSAQIRQLMAILPETGNTLRYDATINVPAGTKLHIGIAGPQPPPPLTPQLPGGAELAILPHLWPVEWVVSVRDLRTGRVYTPAEFAREVGW